MSKPKKEPKNTQTVGGEIKPIRENTSPDSSVPNKDRDANLNTSKDQN